MEIKIKISTGTTIGLPINYNHIIQAIIYNAIDQISDKSDFYHDIGYRRYGRNYKMFQFSKLQGDYYIQDKKIYFKSYISFRVRSIDPFFIRLLAESFWKNGVTIGDEVYRKVNINLSNDTVDEKTIQVKMVTPITVYSTNLETKKTVYYSPQDEQFFEMIKNNFYRKYQAYYAIEPSTSISVKCIDDGLPKKEVTKYKGIYITSWYGTYEISGERKFLDFLYQTGLGSKNAQGFGMFDLILPKKSVAEF